MIRPLTLALLLAVAAPPVVAKQAPAPDYKAALADPARPAADRDGDAARKPAELLAFAGVKPGQSVGDFVMGGGYVTRLLAAAVGSSGKVYAFQPAEFIAFRKQYGDDQAAVDVDRDDLSETAAMASAHHFVRPGTDALVLLALLPVSVSLNLEPMRFSMLDRLSPWASPPAAAPVDRLTCTAAREAE